MGGLDLTPRDYLEMLIDEHREYMEHRPSQISMRKAINCCGLSNALPEIITAHRNPTDSASALKRKSRAYRKYLRDRCKAHGTVQDFCEYSKHVKLERDTVTMEKAEQVQHTQGSSVGLLLALTHPQDLGLLVLTHKGGGRKEHMDEVLERAIASWREIFDEGKL